MGPDIPEMQTTSLRRKLTVKKYVALFGSIVAIAILTCSCSNPKAQFEAKVIETGESFLLIEPIEGEDELRSSDQFSISRTDLDGSDFEEGDIIRITHNGEILETYPTKLGEIYSIELVE